MKVHDAPRPDLADRPSANARRSAGGKGDPSGAARAGAGDRVDLSPTATEAVVRADEVRHRERIATLKAAVEAGRYDVDAEALADAILHDEVLPWLAHR